jgi:hypothetical protein
MNKMVQQKELLLPQSQQEMDYQHLFLQQLEHALALLL